MKEIIITKDASDALFMARFKSEYQGVCGFGKTAKEAIEMLQSLVTKLFALELFG